MSNIPEHLIWDILTHLPPKSLTRFRSVSKAWNNIITCQDFVESHRRHHIGPHQLLLRSTTGKLYSVPLNSLYDKPILSIEAKNHKNLIRAGVPRLSCFLDVSSCDGLILISDVDSNKVCVVWNPFTRDFREVPPCPDLRWGGIQSCGGLGFDRATNEYKVVKISRLPNSTIETLIFSVRANRWRRLMADYPNCAKIEYYTPGVFANGAIHWIINVNLPRGGEAKRIIALDLATENYRLYQLPSFFYERELDHRSLRLNVFEGFLFLSLGFSQDFEIWKLTDQAGENTWVKIYSLHIDMTYRVLYPKLVAYINNNDYEHLLIQLDWQDIILFDLKNNSRKRIDIRVDQPNNGFSCMSLPACTISVRGSNGERTPLTLKRKRNNEGLNLEITSNYWVPLEARDR